QPVTETAHRLHEKRMGRVAFDLTAQPIDLDVHRAFASRTAITGERRARHRLARRGGENPQHFLFAVGQTDNVVTMAQFAARKMIDERPEPYRFHRRRYCRLRTLEN